MDRNSKPKEETKEPRYFIIGRDELLYYSNYEGENHEQAVNSLNELEPDNLEGLIVIYGVEKKITLPTTIILEK